MFGKLLAFVFSFFAAIAIIPLVVTAAVLLFKFDLRSFINLHPLGTAVAMAGYAFYWIFAFFALQDFFLVWKPDPRVVPIGKKELINKLENSFKRPFDGNSLYDVFVADDGRVAITWTASINYLQIVSGGHTEKKRIVILTLDEKNHEAYLLMKEKDLKWSLSATQFDFSMNFSSGIFAEISTEAAPSLTLNRDGSFSIDVKKLTYDYRELWLPIENALLTSGWIIRSGMLPKLSYRLALALPFTILMFTLIYFLLRSAPGNTSASAVEEPVQEAKQVDMEAYGKNDAGHIIKAGRLRSSKDIETTLKGLMKIPGRYFSDYKNAFAAYSKVYREKPDANPEFIARLDEFEKEKGIEQ